MILATQMQVIPFHVCHRSRTLHETDGEWHGAAMIAFAQTARYRVSRTQEPASRVRRPA